MEEFHVSVDGTTYELPKLFMVLATQNPIDMAGTHALPEAQLDRFFMRLSMGYPSLDEEMRIMVAQSQVHPIETLDSVATEAEILKARDTAKIVHINTDVAKYIASITSATRQHPDLRLGASPRGTLALARASQALAYIRGREFVTPDLVKGLAPSILEHRLIVRPQAVVLGHTAGEILKEILNRIHPPVL
jgi:MoxR-like ATPase